MHMFAYNVLIIICTYMIIHVYNIYICMDIYIYMAMERDTNKDAYTDRSSTCVCTCVLNERNTNSYPRPGLQSGPAFQVERVERVGGAADPEMVRWHGMVGADARCGRHSVYRESPGRKMVANVCAWLVWGPPQTIWWYSITRTFFFAPPNNFWVNQLK